MLLNVISNENNWNYLQEKFREYQMNNNIICCSIPVISEEKNKTNVNKQINTYKKIFENETIKLSLEYNYIIVTDISNCYDSIYTHSISWALHNKIEAKNKKTDKTLFGNKIDSILQGMSYGQTNGIPQGSVLMDFIAEIVLGYIDTLLIEKIKKAGIEKYKILRYRDDYKILTKFSSDGERILEILSQILMENGLILNKNKTFISDNIIYFSEKEDKKYFNENIKLDNNVFNNIKKLYNFSKKFPNSGQLKKYLNKK